MIRTPLDQLQARAEHWLTRIQTHHPSARVTSGRSTIGGGSLPGETLPTFLLAIPAAGTLAERYMGALREQPIPVIARVADGELQFDPRTVYPEQEDQLIAAINRLA
jgi:L-seryl-tRNA(Ser) seleniumtransferase